MRQRSNCGNYPVASRTKFIKTISHVRNSCTRSNHSQPNVRVINSLSASSYQANHFKDAVLQNNAYFLKRITPDMFQIWFLFFRHHTSKVFCVACRTLPGLFQVLNTSSKLDVLTKLLRNPVKQLAVTHD